MHDTTAAVHHLWQTIVDIKQVITELKMDNKEVISYKRIGLCINVYNACSYWLNATNLKIYVWNP